MLLIAEEQLIGSHNVHVTHILMWHICSRRISENLARKIWDALLLIFKMEERNHKPKNADSHQQLGMLRKCISPYFPFANTLILAGENNLWHLIIPKWVPWSIPFARRRDFYQEVGSMEPSLPLLYLFFFFFFWRVISL